jgi:preprotein translocase subunit SecA
MHRAHIASSTDNSPLASPSTYSLSASVVKNFFSRIIGRPVETGLGEYWKQVKKIRAFDFSRIANAELAERFHQAASGIQNISPAIEAEIFAIVCEVSRRSLKLDPFDSQIIAGLAMARRNIAELPTGEGKTLAAVFPACLHALSGKGVHVLTFNDYLARRDASWMGHIYASLGLKVGCVQEGMSAAQKRDAYACEVTYASAKEAGFDFLRDQLTYTRDDLIHRALSFAIVDEADSILIDEARIPLVISGAEDRAAWDTNRVTTAVKSLMPGRDFDADAEHRNVFLTEAGSEQIESLLGCGSLYSGKNQTLLESIYCALHAEALLRRDVDYIVRNDRIEIVDEYTGRVVDKRHWPDGLQAAVEAKEGLCRKTEGRTLGSITLQHFFRLYSGLSGMTATARSAADELHEFYGLKVVVVHPHLSSIRVDHPDVIFADREAKRRAVVQEIREVHATGRPILVGTGSIRESEELAADLRSAEIWCSVLNAKNNELEAGIIARAGMFGAVTVSTNMAGRGVDIQLGGENESEREAVAAVGGLYVIGTNRHESLRIDHQLRGRAGRQGDPGATRFFISLEDDLFDRYGLTEVLKARSRAGSKKEIVNRRPMRNEIAHAQRVIESQNFDSRRFLYKFSSLVELQRQIVQFRREKAFKENPASVSPISDLIESNILEEGRRKLGSMGMMELERCATLFHIDRAWSEHLAWIQDTRDSIHLVSLGGQEPLDEFIKLTTSKFLRMQSGIDKTIAEEMRAIIHNSGKGEIDLDKLKGPSSTWTYLVNEQQFGWGLEMLKGKNVGFAYMAARSMGPLFLLALLLDRYFRRKKKTKIANLLHSGTPL